MVTPVFVVQNPRTDDPQVLALVNKVADTFKIEILRSLMRHSETRGIEPLDLNDPISKKVHGAVGHYWSKLSSKRRASVARLASRRDTSKNILAAGRLSSRLSFRDPLPVFKQFDIATEYAFLKPLRPWRPRPNSTSTAGAATPPPPPPMNGGLHLRIHEVKCIAPTSWEPGDDEISMGSVSTDDKANIEIVNEFEVRSDFDTNIARTYSPPYILKSFSLTDATYPKVFSTFIVLAEKDAGGLSAFLEKLWEAVQSHVTKIMEILGAAAGAAIGAKLGASVGAIGGPLGIAIGIIGGMVIGALVGWMVDALKDDIFKPIATAITISGPGQLFDGGSKESSIEVANYVDQGGEYHVSYSWQLNWT